MISLGGIYRSTPLWLATSSFLNFGDLLQKKYALRKVWGWPKYFRKNQVETMNSTKNVIFSLFLTSNIFIEEFTHAWVIFVMIISRLKRGNPMRDRLQTAIDRLRNGYNYMALSLSCSSKWIWVTLKSRVVIPPHTRDLLLQLTPVQVHLGLDAKNFPSARNRRCNCRLSIHCSFKHRSDCNNKKS